MAVVGAPVIRRIVEVANGPEAAEDLLASVGLSPASDPATVAQEYVDAEAYYDLLERVTAGGDHALPFRYAEGLHPDDLGAFGLGLKTARTVGDALGRLVRYILVLSDTLEYELVQQQDGARMVLQGRPYHRRGAQLANECALAAITRCVRVLVGQRVTPAGVSFRHAQPPSDQAHRAFFGCPVRFGQLQDAVHFSDALLATRTRLGDEGLSTYLLARLDDLKQQQGGERSVAAQVRSAVTDALPDGVPSRPAIARRLGMSERTLARRLADHGETFQALADRARREAAQALLADSDHTLTDVAYLTGFADQSAFSRAFKRWTGVTPQAYRTAL